MKMLFGWCIVAASSRSMSSRARRRRTSPAAERACRSTARTPPPPGVSASTARRQPSHRRVRPAPAGACEPGCTPCRRRRSHSRGCRRAAGDASCSGVCLIPTVVELTTRSAPAAASPRLVASARCMAVTPRQAPPNSATRAVARSRVRLAMTSSLAPPRTSAKAAARAAPPAPSSRARLPLGSNPPARRSDSTNPPASVLCPDSRSPRLTMALTAPMSRANSSTSSRWAITSTLCGTVTFAPRYSQPRSRATAAPRSAGLVSHAS